LTPAGCAWWPRISARRFGRVPGSRWARANDGGGCIFVAPPPPTPQKFCPRSLDRPFLPENAPQATRKTVAAKAEFYGPNRGTFLVSLAL
jgi:hypothetical protein